jgi:hypothetical protein
MFTQEGFVRANGAFCAALLIEAAERRELQPLCRETLTRLLSSPLPQVRLVGIRASGCVTQGLGPGLTGDPEG